MSTPKVIVTVAPTGGMATKQQNPNLPTQPEEIAESVYRCYNEGASICALHARRPDDQATCDPAVYRKMNSLIRQKCDIIINNSTGGGVSGDMVRTLRPGLEEIIFEERLKGFEAGAEMATFDCHTILAIFHGRKLLMVTEPERCDHMAKLFKEKGIKPEWEVFNPAHILQDTMRLIEEGYDKPPYFINMVLNAKGFQGGLPYTPEILMQMVSLLPKKDTIFCVSAIGPAQLPATTQAILMGGHVRVGLEDNNYYSHGVLATNEQLVARTVRIIRELGAEPATPAEAREMLGLKPVEAPSRAAAE
jgi:uncharacterized protein (DUF849 family)